MVTKAPGYGVLVSKKTVAEGASEEARRGIMYSGKHTLRGAIYSRAISG